MRLIDADDAVIVLTNRLFEMLKTHIPCVTATESQICLDTCFKIAKYEIDNIPTAYDVSKVIEELEEMQVKAEKDMQLSDNVGEANAYGGMMLAYGLAIPIVEKGGVDE